MPMIIRGDASLCVAPPVGEVVRRVEQSKEASISASCCHRAIILPRGVCEIAQLLKRTPLQNG